MKAATLGSDAFGKRDYWQEENTSSFTRVRSMSTAGGRRVVLKPFGKLENKVCSAPGLSEAAAETYCAIMIGEKEAYSKDLSLNSTSSRTILEHLDCTTLKHGTSAEVLNFDSHSIPQMCASCGKTFTTTDMVVLFESSVLHMACFCCGECSAVVDPERQFLLMDDGSPLCSECTPMCHACNEKITSNHVGVLNKNFHENCLQCSQCLKPFVAMSKVYASGGEPCCAECVTPVFDETWSPRSSSGATLRSKSGTQLSATAGRNESLLNSGGGSLGQLSLPPKLETLSQPAVSDLPSAKKFHSLLRPSFSAPLLSNGATHGQVQKLSLSSLEAILYDELGLSLFMNFCVEESSIELVVFWLDVEHFKSFDGNTDDMKLFAHHIMLKYIGYYAELPLGLPKRIEDQIIADLQRASFSQDIFNEAQQYIYKKMEQGIQARFLQSREGRDYLEAIVTRDIRRRHRNREASAQLTKPMKATVTNFDKRHLDTKFYVYEVEVEMGDSKFKIYRRYSEFYALHQELKGTFPCEKLPAMPKKIIFGRSQTRTVAQQRMRELQAYLQGVLEMPPEISQSRILQLFLWQTPMDKEDEEFNRRIFECQTQS